MQIGVAKRRRKLRLIVRADQETVAAYVVVLLAVAGEPCAIVSANHQVVGPRR
jgi:hypothetical protein